jgi:hypothetical protein
VGIREAAMATRRKAKGKAKTKTKTKIKTKRKKITASKGKRRKVVKKVRTKEGSQEGAASASITEGGRASEA